MPSTRKIQGSDGREHEAEPIGFRTSGEHFNEYLLDDGSVLRIKLVLTNVWKVKDTYDGYGIPPTSCGTRRSPLSMRQTTSGKEVMRVAKKLTDFTWPSPVTISWPSQMTISSPSPSKTTLVVATKKRRKRRGR